MTIDADMLEVYRATVRRREAEESAARAAARKRAWRAAGEAADMLRMRFGAARVVVFGSLVESDGAFFGVGSDIDLAAWGVRDKDYFVAVAHLQTVSPEFGIDLVAMEHCPDHLRPKIEHDGEDL
jgi:predicted nucleotidyltransferase